MRFSSPAVLLFAGAAMASEPRHDCFVKHSEDLAAYSDCGHQGSLAECLSQLAGFHEEDIRKCYTTVGCTKEEAYLEALDTIKRCTQQANTGELKKRYRAAPVADMFERAATTDAAASTTSGGVMSGTRCFTTTKKKTQSCDVTTKNGHISTNTCVSTEVDASTCAPTLICTVDSNNDDICMDLVRMDVGGIIVTIVFAAALVIGAGLLTWACCHDRKAQKTLQAKAEAVALARAATKKQRAAQRQPLIRNPSGGSNPFQDQNRT